MLALEQTYDFMASTMTRPATARLKMSGYSLNVELISSPEGISIVGLPNNNDPDVQAAWMTELERLTQRGTWDGCKLDIDGMYYRPAHALAGWLRAAYLIAFAYFGYSYIVRPELAIVRSHITDPRGEHLVGFHILVPQAARDERQIVVVESPGWLEDSLAVQMGRHIVLLPGFDSDTGLFDRLATSQEQGQVRLTGNVLRWPDRPQYLFDIDS
jgi:hypothetical protein